MSTTDAMYFKSALEWMDQHWAVQAIPESEVARAKEIADSACTTASDTALVKRVAQAYEVAALERLGAVVDSLEDESSLVTRMQAQAAAFLAYTLRRVLPVPDEPQRRIFHVLQLIAMGCVGDQLASVQRWLEEHQKDIELPDVPITNWPLWVLCRLFECWIALVRYMDGDGPMIAESLIAHIRNERGKNENNTFNRLNDTERGPAAVRLLALYHFIPATEIVATQLGGEPLLKGLEECDEHFRSAGRLAWAAHDPELDVTLRWLHAAAKVLIKLRYSGSAGGH